MRACCLLVILGLVSVSSAFAQQASTPGDLVIQQRKLELDVQAVAKRLQDLDQDWQRRWSDERDKIKDDREKAWASLKEDRDRAWTLFTTYILALLGAGVGIGTLLSWWVQRQNSDLKVKIAELDTRLASLPLLHDNLNAIVDELTKNWPLAKRDLKEMKLREELSQLRLESALVLLREGRRMYEEGLRSADPVRCSQILDEEIDKITITLRLTSGDARYVHQAANVLISDNSISVINKELLPRLRAIYKGIDQSLCEDVDKLIATFGTASPSLQ
jgi:hypothetical protein